jgi:hypothetical protein
MTHDCQNELGIGLRDGQRKVCSCGRTWEYVKDEIAGSYWVPQVKQPHNKEASKLRLRKMKTEAQSVKGLIPERKRRKIKW